MKLVAKNRRAQFDYLIRRTITAGVVLSGAEAKSIRLGLVSLSGSFARIKDGELWLFNMLVTPYPAANNQTLPEKDRARKLLVSKRELNSIIGSSNEHETIVPIAVLAGRFIKIELGIGKGRKKFDKRELIKKRDIERSIQKSQS
jgi:SsrA-binding protein